MKYDTHEVATTGHISVRMVKDDGGRHRYCLAPGDNLKGQPQEVVEAANKLWTAEVINAYEAALNALDG